MPYNLPIMRLLRFFFPLWLSGCAVLHHAQVGDIDNSAGFNLRPFDLKVSETGVDFEGAKNIAKALTKDKKAKDALESIHTIMSLFQQGPRTGNPVFSDAYAKNLVNDLYQACPSGRITGLTSIRESRKYPVISGEIVKIKGYCMEKKT